MKKIKNIAVGIDFSVTARKAYCYAKALAQTLNADLTVVHVRENALAGSEADLIKDMEQMMREENSGIDALVKEVKIKVLEGNAADVLSGLPENTGTDLIVMGTTGLSDVLTTLFGSISLKISNQAHCPVILVPKDAKWQPINQVVFASDYDSMKAKFVNRITDFAENVQANIHFVNVRNYDPILEPRQKDIDWNELLQGGHSELGNKTHTIYGNDTVQELKKYCDGNKINLIAFASKHRHFWSNLTHKSISGNMALSTNIPVMVMHLDDES